MLTRILMTATTGLVVYILLYRNISDRKIITAVTKTIREINRQYINLFSHKSFLKILFNSGMLILSQIFMSITIIGYVWRYIDTYLNNAFDFIIKIFIIAVFIIIIYLAVGYIRLITSKVYHVFNEVENRNVKSDLLLSYFLLTMYFAILIFSPVQFERNYVIGLIGVGICYGLNLRVLIKVIRDPQEIRSRGQEEVSASGYIIVAILILIMIILNLFLGVCFINNISRESYSGNLNNFDLFYYTIITFTTIGYGDVVPISIEAKVMSIIISFTSVVCITIFLSSVLSYKNEKK